MSSKSKEFIVYVENYENPTALVKFDGNGRQNEIMLVINWIERTISVITPDEFDYYNWAWMHGHEDIYDLPENVDASQLREWVIQEVVPRAQGIVEAFEIVYHGGKPWGEFPNYEDEQRRFDTWMSIHAEPPTYDWEQWEVADYLPDLLESMSTISDEEIEILADRALQYAAMEGAVFIGTMCPMRGRGLKIAGKTRANACGQGTVHNML